MIRERWEQLVARVDAMSLRERALIFAAAAFMLVALIDAFFLNPLLQQQKRLSSQVIQQQEKMKEIEAQLAALLQAREQDKSNPLRERIRLLREQIAEDEAFLRETQDKLVSPEKMAHLLEQVLVKNGRLQLVALETLPVSNLIESSADAQASAAAGKQIYKHGVKITVRGTYADLTQYLQALERLPTQMFWGMAKMDVVKYPQVELTLTLYTLSLDKTWLQV
jgi:MSHA biogenesis protein MshJ